ncbi:MAG: NTP transferase domain-containing protein [Fidelibacterota bacterium]
MKAIILAAGVSRRLYPLTFDSPKCLLEVGKRPIVDYQMDAIKKIGITEAIVVVGYFREKLIMYFQSEYPDFNLTFVKNEHFFETNTAYSLYLCRQEMEKHETLLMNADVLFPPELVNRLVNSSHDNVMAVDVKECGREEVKVIAGADDKLVAIGKELIQENSLGEFLGIARFSPLFGMEFSSSLKHLIESGGKADYFEAALHPLLSNSDVYYTDISDLPCTEIDFVEDLELAQTLVKSKWYTKL